MRTATTNGCSEAVSILLVGAQLDTIRAYSLIMQLGFIRSAPSQGLPAEIWVSVSGELITGDTAACPTVDFFERRAQALGAAYHLIGRQVTAAYISESRALQIDLGDGSLRVQADGDDNLEEVWAVMSDTPDASVEHRWYVALDDTGALSLRKPT